MNHVQQPKGSRCCGQACVAMLLNILLADACELMGHSHGTHTREVVAAIGEIAIEKRLTPLRGKAIPERALVKVTRPKSSHWSIVIGDRVHDPAFPNSYPLDLWTEFQARNKSRVTSTLQLWEGIS